MDAIRDYLNRPVGAGVGGFVVGLVVGLVVLGWWLFPVSYSDAYPEHLRADFRDDYLRMAVDSYAQNLNAQKARQRFQGLGVDAPELLTAIATEPDEQGVGAISQFSLAVQGEQPSPIEGEAPAETSTGSTSILQGPLATMCGLTLLLAVALAAFFYFRRQQADSAMVRTEDEEIDEDVTLTPTGEEPPLAQFMTTYMLGDDLFDDSFSVDSPAGEFLGECGIGIAETIGVGEPKRVSSFEVWLFDKNDIQTVTKVLMSAHVFGDEATRQRLAAKGEPVLSEPGNQIVLETATLQLVARVVDMSYGEGALPPDSFFERVTLDLAVWPKI
jgi:hypothetical protein